MAKQKMTKLGKELLEGLEEVLAVSKGEKAPARISHVEIPAVDVAKTRKKTGLSQENFSGMIGVSPATLRNWEQGRRQPEGPARVLLAMVEKKPTIVQETLSIKLTMAENILKAAAARRKKEPAQQT